MKKITLFAIISYITTIAVTAQTFTVSYATDLLDENFSGQVLLYLSKEKKNPKDIFVGLEFIPVYRVETQNLAPQTALVFNDNAISYPVEISNIERGTYYAQVVFDRSLGGPTIGGSPGNIYSKPIQVTLSKNYEDVFHLQATEVIPDIEFKGTETLKELVVSSSLLSEFHKKEVTVNAAVQLPKSYASNPDANYPVVFSTFGFGANYKIHSGHDTFLEQLGDQETIIVYLDGACPEGHSTYANSDVNGPWGDAFVKEFIPALEKQYRTNGAYFLHGHSSGGWTSLWLQVNYPKTFAGAWASAPDQVDFRNYQNKNIYEIKEMFYDKDGRLLPDITIAGHFPIVSAKDFYSIEHVIYRGSQMHSFDAVFGGYDDAGNRIRLIHMPSGEINQAALPLWKRYDLSIILRNNWDSLKEGLNGKIRISIGSSDNFHLHHAVKLLEEEMTKLNADMDFEYYPGDHFTIFTKEYQEKGNAFLTQCYENWLKSN